MHPFKSTNLANMETMRHPKWSNTHTNLHAHSEVISRVTYTALENKLFHTFETPFVFLGEKGVLLRESARVRTSLVPLAKGKRPWRG